MATLTIPDNIFSRLKRLADAHHRSADEEGTALLQKNLSPSRKRNSDPGSLSGSIKAMRSRQKTKVEHSIATELKREGRA